jgi:hypothetical protein
MFRTSTSYLIIQVIDINDHPPVFQLPVYTATLSEAAPVGSFVAAPQVFVSLCKQKFLTLRRIQISLKLTYVF